MWEAPPLHVLVSSVNEPSNPIGMRMRATYYLRQAYTNATKELPDSSSTFVHETKSDDSSDASPSRSQSHPSSSSSHPSTPSETISTIISTLGHNLQTPTHGSLMRHEFAYVMGQLREPRCCPYLEQTLDDLGDDVMVRHECAEALGAIADPASLVRLEYHANEDSRVEISETCRIAVDFLRWTLGEGTSGEGEGEEGRPEYDAPMACACMLSPYDSIDPAPPHPSHASIPTTQLGLNLRSPTHPLFERYRIMFSLRNRGSKDAVVELCETLVNDESSALLRHEIAYVLGQMQHPVSIDYLAESLRREGEHVMVRHEAAEALGAIEGEWERCEVVLREFLGDEDVVVRESCEVALDAADYWGTTTNVTAGDDSIEEEAETKDDGVNGSVPVVSFAMAKAGFKDLAADVMPAGNVTQKRAVLNSHFNVVF